MIIFCGGNSYNLGNICNNICVFLLSKSGNLPVKETNCKVTEEIDIYLNILGNTSLPVIIQYSNLSDLALEKIEEGSALSVYLYEDPREILTNVNEKKSFAKRFLKIWRTSEENWLPPLSRTLIIDQKNLRLDPSKEIASLAEYLSVEIPDKTYVSQEQSAVINKENLTPEQLLLIETLLDEMIWRFATEDKNHLTASIKQNLALVQLESLLLEVEKLLISISNFRANLKAKYYDSLDKKLIDTLINIGHLKEAGEICHLLGTISLQDNEPEQSKRWYLKALEVQPQQAKSLYNLGYLYEEEEDWQAAKSFYQRAININPEYSKAHYRLGLIYKRNKQIEEAIAEFSRVLELEPNHQGAKFNLAFFWKQGEKVDFIAAMLPEKDLELLPGLREFLNDTGVALFKDRKLEEARSCFQSLIELDSDCLLGYFNLAGVLQELKNYTQAIAAYNKVLKIDENYIDALKGLGYVYYKTEEFDRARQCFQKALEIEPDNAGIYSTLGHLAAEQGLVSDSVSLFNEALKLNPAIADLHSGFLFNLSSLDTFTPQEIFNSARLWYEQQVVKKRLPLLNAAPMNREPQRRLRIGYISPDFRQHSVSRFIKQLLAHHDRSQVEVFCYGEVKKPDKVTEEIIDICDAWRYTQEMSDVELAESIRRDGIDILVDLAGHTADNRLEVLGMKPAPIQATYLGYFATTGLPTIDYWITDAYLHPQDTSEVTSENIWRLPRCYVSFEPESKAPPVTSLPHNKTGIFTFASFNHFRKLTPTTFELWAEILKGVPNSRLILKCHGSDVYSSPIAGKIQRAFVEKGIEPQRISLYGAFGEEEDHFNLYNQVDIHLDSMPYTGCTTTCEALWMGVPTLTLAGERKMERMSATILHTLGLDDFIATSRAEYVEKAIYWARNTDDLNSLRLTMRDRMLESELLDGRNMARAMEDAYRQMWHTYLSQHGARGSVDIKPPNVAGLQSSAAIELLQNFIAAHAEGPHIWEGYYQLGRLYHDLAVAEAERDEETEDSNHTENAISYYLQALCLSRSHPEVYSSLARLLVELEIKDQAEEYYRYASLLNYAS